MTQNATNNKRILIIAAAAAVAVIAIIIAAISINSRGDELKRQLDLGYQYLSELDYDQALVAFNAAIEIDPKSVDAYLGAAAAYIGLGDSDSAIEILLAGYNETSDQRIADRLSELNVTVSADSSASTSVSAENPYEDLDGEAILNQFTFYGFPLTEDVFENAAGAMGLEIVQIENGDPVNSKEIAPNFFASAERVHVVYDWGEGISSRISGSMPGSDDYISLSLLYSDSGFSVHLSSSNFTEYVQAPISEGMTFEEAFSALGLGDVTNKIEGQKDGDITTYNVNQDIRIYEKTTDMNSYFYSISISDNFESYPGLFNVNLQFYTEDGSTISRWALNLQYK